MVQPDEVDSPQIISHINNFSANVFFSGKPEPDMEQQIASIELVLENSQRFGIRTMSVVVGAPSTLSSDQIGSAL